MSALLKAATHSAFLVIIYVGVCHLFDLPATVAGAAMGVAIGAMVRTYEKAPTHD